VLILIFLELSYQQQLGVSIFCFSLFANVYNDQKDEESRPPEREESQLRGMLSQKFKRLAP